MIGELLGLAPTGAFSPASTAPSPSENGRELHPTRIGLRSPPSAGSAFQPSVSLDWIPGSQNGVKHVASFRTFEVLADANGVNESLEIVIKDPCKEQRAGLVFIKVVGVSAAYSVNVYTRCSGVGELTRRHPDTCGMCATSKPREYPERPYHRRTGQFVRPRIAHGHQKGARSNECRRQAACMPARSGPPGRAVVRALPAARRPKQIARYG
jgi:hypothetical protein